jgi:hypothetical protein
MVVDGKIRISDVEIRKNAEYGVEGRPFQGLGHFSLLRKLLSSGLSKRPGCWAPQILLQGESMNCSCVDVRPNDEE